MCCYVATRYNFNRRPEDFGVNRISAMPTSVTASFSHWDSLGDSSRTQESNVKTRLDGVSSVPEVSVSPTGDTVELFERTATVNKNPTRFNPYGNSADARLARAGIWARATTAENSVAADTAATTMTATITTSNVDTVAAETSAVDVVNNVNKEIPASNASFTPTIMPWHDDWVAAGAPEYGSIAWNNFIDNWNIAKGHNVSDIGDAWFKMKPDPTENLFPSVTEEEQTETDASTLTSDAKLSQLERGEISINDFMNAFSA